MAGQDEKDIGSIYEIRAAAFSKVDWEDAIKASTKKRCDEYSRLFFSKAEQLRSFGDITGFKVHAVLGAVCHYYFRPREKAANPFGPVWQSVTGRSAAPEDLGRNGLPILRAITTRTSDPELAARANDLLWLIGKNEFNAARKAADAYIASAERLTQIDGWTSYVPRFQRALQLGARLGKEKKHFRNTIRAIERLLASLRASETTLASVQLLQLLYEQRSSDPKQLGDHAAEIAARFDASKNPNFARHYWNQAVLFYRSAPSGEGLAKNAAIKAAETFAAEAGQAEKGRVPSHAAAGGFLAQAIDALRKAGGSKPRIGQLTRAMVSHQKLSTKELGRFSHELDLTDCLQIARDGVSNKSLQDALMWLAENNRPIDEKALRKNTIKNFKQFPLQHLIGAEMIDERGRVIARKPPGSFSDKEQMDEAIFSQMVMDTRLHRQLMVRGLLLPAIDTIMQQHEPRLADLVFLVLHNPFIPQGYEEFYARGLLAGLRGNFLEAAHYLVCQIENSIRHVLELRGVIATGLDNELLQSNYGLKKLLTEMPQAKRIFGADMVFDLRCLLIEKLGANLRNNFAHGLMPFGSFYTGDTVYLWGLCLRLAASPLIMQRRRQQEGQLQGAGD